MVDLRHQPKVREFCIEGRVQHYVTWLDIPVHDGLMGTFIMEVCKTGSYTN
uniref:Uncharacterized protein n=1 Tax=Arundo donax TaxID=35708 RepID=A0A0A9AEI8_ARUDO